ncbi:MAG: TIR domain-containing protein [Methanoregula sp.]|nr:TIR domain-containing protein [Methanoregula sp.]
MIKNHNLFISHAWRYSEAYSRLEDLLKIARQTPSMKFNYRNYSVPKHDPLIDPKTPIGFRKLKAALDSQISPASCVLIISGMYVAHRPWLQIEIDIANKYEKPIIGIIPRGQINIPLEVQRVAREMVGWNTESIIKAIRRHSL